MDSHAQIEPSVCFPSPKGQNGTSGWMGRRELYGAQCSDGACEDPWIYRGKSVGKRSADYRPAALVYRETVRVSRG